MPAIDLNADLGESYGVWQLGDDAAMLEVVTSANVACGFHAGDPSTLRRTCLVAAERGVVIGAQAAVDQVLSAWGWVINTAFVERLNLSLRQRVAPIRRRSATSCKGETGLDGQLTLFQVYYNFVLPHAHCTGQNIR